MKAIEEFVEKRVHFAALCLTALEPSGVFTFTLITVLLLILFSGLDCSLE